MDTMTNHDAVAVEPAMPDDDILLAFAVILAQPELDEDASIQEADDQESFLKLARAT